MVFKKALLFCLLLLISAMSAATSCRGLTHRVVGECTSGQCEKIFYVKEIPAYELCDRLSVLSPVPGWARKALEREVSNQQPDAAGIYELSVRSGRYPNFLEINSFDDYLERLDSKDLDAYILNNLERYKVNSYERALDSWRETERLEYWIDFAKKWGNRFAGFALLILLLRTVFWYRRWLIKNQSVAWFWRAFAAQIILFLVATGLLLNLLMYELLPFYAALLVIWLYQLIAPIFIRGRQMAV